ncbi:MAG: hypothetical protein OXN25_13610 [Candidatus Poribacteria bacterium]|nr:hypothetical protein [Candidatus Poribacteria bacterium]
MTKPHEFPEATLGDRLHTLAKSGGGLCTTMSGGGAFQKRTTKIGDSFLEFITAP